jgi:hypothetical protein
MAAAIFCSFDFCWTFGGCHDKSRGENVSHQAYNKTRRRQPLKNFATPALAAEVLCIFEARSTQLPTQLCITMHFEQLDQKNDGKERTMVT